MNIPNILTLARIIMIPLMVICYYWLQPHGGIYAAILFSLAAVTDWFDGYLARKLNQQTALGAFLDPVADKLIVAIALVLLVETFQNTWLTIPAMIIVGREIVISALREWMAELGKRQNIAVSLLGKLKTSAQMLSIVLLLASEGTGILADIGFSCLTLAAALTLWSMVVYLKAALPDLKQ